MVRSRTKILLAIPSLAGGGAERFFTNLLQHLDRDRFEPHLALLEGESAYLQDVPMDVVVHEIRVRRVRYALPGIIRIARQVRPKVILSTLAHMNQCVLLARPFLPREIKLIVREAISPSMIEGNALFLFFSRIFYQTLYRRADKIVCLSDGMAEEIAEFGISRDKLVRIYNPVDVERVRELAASAENPYSGAGPQLVAVGRLCHQKGFDLLLSAMPRVREALPHARLAILGQGPLGKELEIQAQKLGLQDAVRFWGFQQNPWTFIEHADVFVLPSRYEGLPNALLEAMALHKPIVATDCPGAVGEIASCIPGMTVIPMEDPETLARAVISACKMSSHSTNGNGKSSEDAFSRFDLKTIVGEYSTLFLS
jgi:glycosyltransferase involved in cell wall biosynthesis